MPINLGKSRKKNGKAAADVSQDDLAGLFGRAVAGDIDADVIKRLTRALRHSLKVSRKGITVSGQGMAELLLKIAPRIPASNAGALRAKSGGMSGESLAGYTVKRASRHSAAVGGLAGGLASAGTLAPPAWLLPAEIVVETVLIASIEMRMVAELHEIYGRPIKGTSEERGVAILSAWSERRGVDLNKVGQNGLGDGASKGARNQLVHLIRRKLIARAARNISTIAPLLIGAAVAAEINRRATRDLGDALVRDLGGRPPEVVDTTIVDTTKTASPQSRSTD